MAWLKLIAVRDAVSTEIMVMGVTGTDDPLLITDIIVPKQECTTAYCEPDDDDVARIQYEHCQREDGPKLSPSQIMRVWIHTHPEGMGASPSGTDTSTFDTVYRDMDWSVMLIVSKRGDVSARLRMRSVVSSRGSQRPLWVDKELQVMRFDIERAFSDGSLFQQLSSCGVASLSEARDRWVAEAREKAKARQYTPSYQSRIGFSDQSDYSHWGYGGGGFQDRVALASEYLAKQRARFRSTLVRVKGRRRMCHYFPCHETIPTQCAEILESGWSKYPGQNVDDYRQLAMACLGINPDGTLAPDQEQASVPNFPDFPPDQGAVDEITNGHYTMSMAAYPVDIDSEHYVLRLNVDRFMNVLGINGEGAAEASAFSKIAQFRQAATEIVTDLSRLDRSGHAYSERYDLLCMEVDELVDEIEEWAIHHPSQIVYKTPDGQPLNTEPSQQQPPDTQPPARQKAERLPPLGGGPSV